MKTPEQIHQMIKKIDKSNRSPHHRIKDVLTAMVEILDHYGLNGTEPEEAIMLEGMPLEPGNTNIVDTLTEAKEQITKIAGIEKGIL